MIWVLLASYNGSAFIRQQLDSVLNQTVHDLRVVISDDLSTDGTPEIIREYENAYPDRIMSLPNEHPSGGAAANFFRLLSWCRNSCQAGDYAMFCDQDDIWLPEKVEKTMEKMKTMENHYGTDMPILVHTDLSVTDSQGKVLHPSMVHFQKIGVTQNELNHYLVENNITGNTIMMNTALIRLADYIPRECTMHDWWLGLLASSFGEIGYVNQPLVLYRQHGNNTLGAKSGLEQSADRLSSGDRVKENYRKMFLQAELFLDHYRSRLSGEQISLLEHFLEIPGQSRLKKIDTILRYRLLKSTPVRTLGQMFSI